MCTIVSDSEAMVCDVSRDRVRDVLMESLGDAARVETVRGEGTRFTCADAERIPEFQASVREVLGWADDSWR